MLVIYYYAYKCYEYVFTGRDGYLEAHDNCYYHKFATKQMLIFEANYGCTENNIDAILDKTKAKMIRENREKYYYVYKIYQTLFTIFSESFL